jgi:hypothetical protein
MAFIEFNKKGKVDETIKQIKAAALAEKEEEQQEEVLDEEQEVKEENDYFSVEVSQALDLVKFYSGKAAYYQGLANDILSKLE